MFFPSNDCILYSLNILFLYLIIIYVKDFDDYFQCKSDDSKSTLNEMPQNHRFLKELST